MKRSAFIGAFLLIGFYTALTFISSSITFPLILPLNPVSNFKFYDYGGISHAHSLLSTGSGTIEEMSRAASKARCSFLIVTDLNPPRTDNLVEGYHDDVAVIVAAEYSFLGGHLLTYDLPEAASFKGLGQAQIVFNDLLGLPPRTAKHGLLIAAHPFLPQHSWDHLNNPGLSGMEILNLDSIWRSEIAQNKLSVLWSFMILPFNPDLSYIRLFNEPVRELVTWDDILKRRSFIGFGGSDSTANAIPIPNKSFKFPSYTRSFGLMKDHILLKSELTGSFHEDRIKIMDSLAKGNFYFSLDLIGNPRGFYFSAQQRRQEYLLGSTLNLSHGPIKLTVDMGRDIDLPHEIILFRNGQRVGLSNGRKIEYNVEQGGAYRAVVRVIPTLPLPDGKTWFTWIYSNAIRVE